jgi:hypothetical protein
VIYNNKTQKGIIYNQELQKEVKCFIVFSFAIEPNNRYHITKIDHITIPELQEEQERGHEQNFLKQ